MPMLPLDDPRWAELDHRGWAKGARSGVNPNASFVPDELAKLASYPSEIERFHELWPYLCSEDTTWAAAYAAVPHVVEMIRRLPLAERFEPLCFLGLVVTDSCPELGESFAIKPYLLESYQEALVEALPLLTETLVARHDSMETRYLLATAAALKGHPRLGGVLANLDCISQACPRCGEDVYPEELQRAVERPGPA